MTPGAEEIRLYDRSRGDMWHIQNTRLTLSVIRNIFNLDGEMFKKLKVKYFGIDHTYHQHPH